MRKCNKNKITACILAAVMALSLCACGSGGDSKPSGSTAASKSSEGENKPTEGEKQDNQGTTQDAAGNAAEITYL